MKFRKELNDDEYIAKIRRSVPVAARANWLWLALGVLLSLLLPPLAAYFISQLSNYPGPQLLMLAGFGVGAIAGFLFAGIWVQAGLCFKAWMSARRGLRTERLLLKYHDELARKNSLPENS